MLSWNLCFVSEALWAWSLGSLLVPHDASREQTPGHPHTLLLPGARDLIWHPPLCLYPVTTATPHVLASRVPPSLPILTLTQQLLLLCCQQGLCTVAVSVQDTVAAMFIS